MVQSQIVEDEEPPTDFYPAGFLHCDAEKLRINSVTIDGLKGFNETVIELRPLSILTGPNNSGKSTVLQAIGLAFECIRRTIDYDKWKFTQSGKAVFELEFLPVNHPKDLWFETITKPTKDKERMIKVKLKFSNNIELTARIRYLFGFLNVGLENAPTDLTTDQVKQIADAIPILIPAAPGPESHEERLLPAKIQQILSVRQPSKIIRNIIFELQREDKKEELKYIQSVITKYFSLTLNEIKYDETRDIAIRAPVKEGKYQLDVISEGSGFNQILLLASVIAWRKPTIVLLDEPDAHLHSSIQTNLLEFISDLVERYDIQIILATHSKDLIGQAPIDSIIPIDRTRKEIKPLQSIDHLLLEYRRQGIISNVDLALLYQTKKCLFVEGIRDINPLRLISEKFNIDLFHGRNQIVLFDLGGVDKMSNLPDLVRLFEKLVGASLQWGVVQDSHSNIPVVKEKINESAKNLKIPLFHQWQRHSMENYLIEPVLLKTAVEKKKTEISLDKIKELLSIVVSKIQVDAESDLIEKTEVAFKKFEIAGDPRRAAVEYKNSLDTLEKKLAVFPGKKILGGFIEELQNKYGIQLRLTEILNAINETNIDPEVKDCLFEIKAYFEKL
jgi:ABC-type cobalamin/Fe3+-siderophores transport system ATPase subunit